jgi:glycerol-3-phosphate dehydrogenase
MRRDLQRLQDETFDLCIIGGGINGLATAWDATLRGLSVALVERGDFGGETSANSLKILHGGLRYLQHLDFSRMTESIRERNALMRMAPHLVEPLGFLVPTYPGLAKGRAALRAALAVNDLIGCRRNRGLRDPNLLLPPGTLLSPAEVRARVPELPAKDLTGGALFYDARMRNSDRFTLSFALSAAARGACLANRVEGLGFDTDARHIRALRARDVESGADFAIKARLFAVMTGPWRDQMARLLPGRTAPSDVVKSAGIQVVTTRRICPDSGLALPSRHADAAARLQRGARHYFSTPWRGHTLWGTTDKIYRGDPAAWRIGEADILDFLAELNECLPGMALRRDEVTFAFGGLRMMDAENIANGSRVSRRYAVRDHADDLGVDNLISMDGIKYTACRIMAEKAVDLACRKLGGSPQPSRTAMTPLWGGEPYTRSNLELDIAAAAPKAWGAATASLLAESYGTQWQAVVARGQKDPARLPDGVTPAVLVDHAIERELALHLEDVLFRRTPLGTLGAPPEAVLLAVADRMGERLAWSPARREHEIGRIRARYVHA